MKFLLQVIGFIMYTICIVHTYFDLISVPLSLKFFSLLISYAGVDIHSTISSYAKHSLLNSQKYFPKILTNFGKVFLTI